MVDLTVRPVRGPRAAAHGSRPAGEHGDDRRPPEVEVPDDHRASIERGEPSPEIAELYRRRVREPRAQVHRDEIEIVAADVQRHVQGESARCGITRHVPDGNDLDDLCRDATHDGEAEAAAAPMGARRDEMWPRVHAPAPE